MSISGMTSDKGKLMISNKFEMDEFFKNHPGKKVILKASVLPDETSKSLAGYYNLKIVPDFQNIFREKEGERMSLKEVDEKLRSMCPVMWEEVPEEEAGGFSLERLKSVYEVGNTVLLEFIDHIRMIAGSEYDYFIEDPKRY